MRRHLLAFAFVGFVVGCFTFAATRSHGFVDPAPLVLPAQDRLLGAGSCASAACHNSGDTSKIAGREYALCIADKHDQAYAVLLEDRSKKIEQRLHGLTDWKTAHPERDLLCLKCHVHPDVDRSPSRVVDGVRLFRLEDGVSCESCHGAAERWLDSHHRPEWKRLSAADKKTYGMTDTRDIVSRAQACVQCHVGDAAKGMEVNHELIAAGHPRLAFEFTSYHSLMTKHWDDALDRDPKRGGRADFEADAWMKGQAIALKASLELLHQRAAGKAWPEFAEFDCYACHHDLRNPGSKQDRAFAGTAGRLTWSRWPASQAETALSLLLGKNDPDLPKGLEAIGGELNKLQPNKDVLGREIPKVIGALDRALLVSKKDAPPTRDGMAAIAAQTPKTWDDAAQTYAGLIAWEKTRLDRRQPEIKGVRPGLEALRQLLMPDARYRLKDVEPVVGGIAKSLGR